MFASFAKLTWEIHENLHPQNSTDFPNHENKFTSNFCRSRYLLWFQLLNRHLELIIPTNYVELFIQLWYF